MADLDPVTARPNKLKEYLRNEAIEFDDAADARELRTLCVRRMRRKAREQRRSDPLASAWGVDTAYSVSALKELAENMKTHSLMGKRFEKVLFKIDDVNDNIIVHRHSDSCWRRIVDGMCPECKVTTPGIPCFSTESSSQT